MTLLLGHIDLHGLRRPDLAAGYYQLTLDCKPQNTLADLAKQRLQRSLVEPEAVQSQEIGTYAVEPSAESLPSMLQDPFPSEPVVTVEVEPSDNEQPLTLLIPEERFQTAWLKVSIPLNQTRADSISIDQAKPS